MMRRKHVSLSFRPERPGSKLSRRYGRTLERDRSVALQVNPNENVQRDMENKCGGLI